MTRLIAPKSSVVVVKYGLFWRSRKWHILKPATQERGICGAICLEPMYSTIKEIKAEDLCALCWPFAKE